MNDEVSREHERIEREIARSDKSSDPFAAAVHATRMPMLITDPGKPDNPIVFANDAFGRLTGYGRDEILGKNCRLLQGAETDRNSVMRLRTAIAERVPVELDLLNYKKSGEPFWNRLLISPVFDAEGSLIYFFASQFDVTLEKERLVRLQSDRDALEREVERRTGDLARSEDRLRFILQAGRFGAWTLDLLEGRLIASAVCKENFGRDPSEPFTYGDLLEAVDPLDRDRMKAAVADSIERQADYDIEYRIRTLQGERRWVHMRGQTSYAADGTPLSMAGVSIDVTDRKEGEEHRALLAAELSHRVKNSMANIQAIANQTLRNAQSLDEARDTLNARLGSLARAHDVLINEGWASVSMAEVVDGALEPFRSGHGSRFTTAGPDVRLTPRLALAFVLAIHELATNAVKYGALSNDIGRIRLDWEIRDGTAPDRLWMRWEEIGGPPVAKPTRTGFGSRMIEQALASELGGTGVIDYRIGGVVFTVEAPLPAIDATAET